MESIVYDESGQLLSGSFQDYCMPRADNFCFFELGNNVSPTDRNPLGVKGVGEAGTLGAIPAVMNAINDALVRIGASPIEMPATSERVWRAIRKASGAAARDDIPARHGSASPAPHRLDGKLERCVSDACHN
jgi:carbon-monoxide dehydrogenase large subunit